MEETDLDNVHQLKLIPWGITWLGKIETHQSSLAKQGLFPALAHLLHGQLQSWSQSFRGPVSLEKEDYSFALHSLEC